MTRLAWTRSLSSCSGAWAWSALDKQTQITAWWEWSQPRETMDKHSCISLPPTVSQHFHFTSLTRNHFAQPQHSLLFSPRSLSPAWWWQCDGVWWPAAGCAVVQSRLQKPSWPQRLHQAVHVQWLDPRCDGPLHSHSANWNHSSDDVRQLRDVFTK